MTTLDEETVGLVARSLDGDQEAFGTLLDSCLVRLMLFIRRQGKRVLQADCDAEDLFQAVALRAWGALPGFRERNAGSFFAWLRTLARNEILDRVRYREAKGRDRVRHLESGADSASDGREPLSPMTTVRTLAVRHEEIERVHRAMEALAPEQAKLVELHTLEERTLRDIAAELDIPKSTVWDRLTRAMRRLRELAGEGTGVA